MILLRLESRSRSGELFSYSALASDPLRHLIVSRFWQSSSTRHTSHRPQSDFRLRFTHK